MPTNDFHLKGLFMKRLVLLMFFLFMLLPIQAQEAFLDYRWEFGDLALRYPSNWDEPLQRFSTDGNQVMLMLAQDLVDSAERPPAIPFITISLLRGLASDAIPYEILEDALQEMDIDPVGELPTSLFGEETIGTQGYSLDGLLFGIGRIHYLDETRGTLLITGRAPAAQRDEFVALFNGIANSITLSASQATTPPVFGVLWHKSDDFSDGENALLDIAALTLGDDGRIYLADRVLGIVVLDSQTGIIQSITPFEQEIEPSAILVHENRMYLADTLCACIHIYGNGRELALERDFGEFAPRSIALAPDDRLYATDIVDEQVVIRSMGDSPDEVLVFELPPLDQPLLTIDRAGRLLVLADNSLVYALVDGILSFQYELQASFFPTAITVDDANRLVVATDGAGIFVFNNLGELIYQLGTPVESNPQAGEVSRPLGIATGQDGSIYWAESDGTIGTVTAMSLEVEAGRIGRTNLSSGVEVQGNFDTAINRQLWTFDGLRGDIVTVTALASDNSFNLDLAIQVLDPSGREIAAVDNDDEGFLLNFLDAQLRAFSLPSDGQYYLIIERKAGEGAYRLGLSRSQVILLEENETTIAGALGDTIPNQIWLFEGRAGQTATITMQAAEGSNLDPMLSLLTQRGDFLIGNDDAEDPELGLGFNSQIFAYRLPSTSLYRIEAGRFTGEGNYRLSIVLE
jgi:hypothetical protein